MINTKWLLKFCWSSKLNIFFTKKAPVCEDAIIYLKFVFYELLSYLIAKICF